MALSSSYQPTIFLFPLVLHPPTSPHFEQLPCSLQFHYGFPYQTRYPRAPRLPADSRGPLPYSSHLQRKPARSRPLRQIRQPLLSSSQRHLPRRTRNRTWKSPSTTTPKLDRSPSRISEPKTPSPHFW